MPPTKPAILDPMNCAFCTLPAARIVKENDLALLIQDAYPVSAGHSLVIPRRHIGSWFEANGDERSAMLALLDQAKALIKAEYNPDSFNIGINDGPAAGQTVPHLHMHLIPRFHGDVPDPRGGVRWVIADKAKYWKD
jgi:diadenosine tetraphosphate (Ap4A) HIT family hydrolase